MLREHGFAVAENAEMGNNPADGIHAPEGFHYKCRRSGALDVNADNGPGTEKSIIDGIVAEVQKLGFRTIWQAAGHFDHIHIDVANSGPIGVGGGDGGAVGALEETGLDVKLIDWDAEYEAVHRWARRLRDRHLLRRRSRPARGQDAVRGARRHRRLAEDPAGDVRDRDRRVRRAQPAPTATATRSACSSSGRRWTGASATRSWTPRVRRASSSGAPRSRTSSIP